eukprot:gene6692-8278_t
MTSINIGDKGESTHKVEEKHFASNVGSGDIDVFSTPSMIALMEGAAVNCLKGKLEEGQTSVGTQVQIKHLAATPLGVTVRATATVTGGDGKKQVIFSIEAFDNKDKIGEGTHERLIVGKDRFLSRVMAKKDC